jgi:hypothetical protein
MLTLSLNIMYSTVWSLFKTRSRIIKRTTNSVFLLSRISIVRFPRQQMERVPQKRNLIIK